MTPLRREQETRALVSERRAIDNKRGPRDTATKRWELGAAPEAVPRGRSKQPRVFYVRPCGLDTRYPSTANRQPNKRIVA
jgi:hypothetical protein